MKTARSHPNSSAAYLSRSPPKTETRTNAVVSWSSREAHQFRGRPAGGDAALRAGAGKLQIANCQSIATHLGLAVPEALVLALPETPSGEIDPAPLSICARGSRVAMRF